jgi:hypothetical protein
VSEEQHGSIGFVLYQQDWRGHQPGDPQPPILQIGFVSRAEAVEQKNRLRQQFPDPDIVLLCVAPAPGPRKAKQGRR